jgi:predicted Fe-S protein YdhL (DUF1289 family)
MKISTEINSPCIGACALGAKDICVGCFRSIDEILMWGNADNENRLLIIEHALKRQSETV